MFAVKETYQKVDNRVNADPAELFKLAELMFDQGKSIIIGISGNSMYPFIRYGVDSVEIFRVSVRDIKVSDIILVKHGGGYVLRRVYKIADDDFYAIGDAEAAPNGPYSKSDIAGKVTVIFRKGKRIPCSSPAMRILVFVWGLLRPLRPAMIHIYRKLHNLDMKKKLSDDNGYGMVEHRISSNPQINKNI